MQRIILTICTFLFLLQSTFAQKKPVIQVNNKGITECGTLTPSKAEIEEAEKKMSNLIKNGTQLASPTSIPIKAHIVRTSAGTGGLSTTVLNAAIATMNTKYATMNLSFFLCGAVHYIDSDTFYDTDVDVENNALVQNNVNDAVNIYFVGNLTASGAGLNGISAFPSSNPLSNRIIMWNDATSNGVTLPHEMGHYWNLYHTHETAVGTELVNGSNCSTAGDLVCDTPADPCCYNYNASTCTYTGTGKDANNQSYTPLINNLMSYYGLCRNVFTTGQFSRMDAGYALRQSYLGTNSYLLACSASAISAPTNVNSTLGTCAINLTWTDNATNEMGYLIERSTSSTGPFILVGRVAKNTTSFTDNKSLNSGATYYYRIVAANANANYSTVKSVVANFSTACYCTPDIQNCTDSDVITNVTISQSTLGLLNNTSSCSTNGYSYVSSPVTSLINGSTYTMSVSNPGLWDEGCVAWIDYNKNGLFESSEMVFSKALATWTNATGSFTVPTSSLIGQTRMRVRISYDTDIVDIDPCVNASSFGETEDYLVNIVCNVAAPIATAGSSCGTGTVSLSASGCTGGIYKWYDVAAATGTPLATGTPFTTPSLNATKTYYVTCTIGPCTSTAASAIATIKAVPNAPTIAPVTINLGATATLTATNCAGTVTWYDVATAGTALNTGASFTTPTLTSNKTYYASCTANGCTSLTRGSAVVTVNCNLPDLIITNVNITKYTSSRIDYTVAIKNQGQVNADLSSVFLGVRTSPDAISNANDVFKSQITVGGGSLAPNTTLNFTNWTSFSFTDTQYYLIHTIDDLNLLTECTDTNNVYIKLVNQCTGTGDLNLTGTLLNGFYSSTGVVNITNATLNGYTLVVGRSIIGTPNLVSQNTEYIIGGCLEVTAPSAIESNKNMRKRDSQAISIIGYDSISNELLVNVSESGSFGYSVWDTKNKTSLNKNESKSFGAGIQKIKVDTSSWKQNEKYIISIQHAGGIEAIALEK